MVAAAAGTPTLIIICWCVGALYALMGAVSVSELAALYPEAVASEFTRDALSVIARAS